MNKAGRILCTSLAGLSLLLGVAASAANAADALGPRRRPGHGGTNPIRSVAEPGAIALLGAGLVTLGIYASRKNKKK
jgi:hypothetical protein